MFFNVFEAAPENDRDGPAQQAAQNAGGKVTSFYHQGISMLTNMSAATRIFPVAIISWTNISFCTSIRTNPCPFQAGFTLFTQPEFQ